MRFAVESYSEYTLYHYKLYCSYNLKLFIFLTKCYLFYTGIKHPKLANIIKSFKYVLQLLYTYAINTVKAVRLKMKDERN